MGYSKRIEENYNFYKNFISNSFSNYEKAIMFDPQTSGGLLIFISDDNLYSLPKDLKYDIIGKVINYSPQIYIK